MNKQGQLFTSTIVKIILSILCVSFGILSLILLSGQGFHYTIYVPILMMCISVATFLLLSTGTLGILRHKKIELIQIINAKKWIYTFAGGVALMIASPLAIILLSAKGISPFIFVFCFFVVLSLSVILVVVGIANCINICRESSKDKYILFKGGETCPCRKINCKYHGDCESCMDHHYRMEPKTKTKCDHIKTRMERNNRKRKVR